MSINRTKARLLGGLLLAVAGTLGVVSAAGAQGTLKIAYIDPLSGPFANVGDLGLKHFQHIANHINAKGGVLGQQIEIVPFDSKGSPQESLVALRTIADQGIRYITQGNGSHIAAALIEGVEKNNQRNPGKEMLFLSYAAQNPELTNEKCSYWHFRFDDHAGMKLHGITEYMVSQPDIKKVFLLNQDYGFGHMVDSISKQMLAEKSTDIEVVGSIFHPIGKVKDFSPYIAQIRASGADSVITGNWGNDMALLIKASASAGLDVKYYAFSVGALGTPTALGKAGENRVFQVNEWHPDLPIEENQPEMDKFAKAFKQQTKLEYFHLRSRTLVEMLVKAMEESNSTDPVKVAKALENMRHETAFGTAIMRAEDHQLLQPQYIAKFTKEATNDLEDTGLGFVTVQRLPAEQLGLPTTCDMKRPH